MSLTSLLAWHIRANGPVKTARVSSAQSSAPYPYWGAVRYQITLTARAGKPWHKPTERATSDRRSVAGAERDRDAMCEREGRIVFDGLGRLSEEQCEYILGELGYVGQVESHRARAARRQLTPPPKSLPVRLAEYKRRKLLASWPNLRIADCPAGMSLTIGGANGEWLGNATDVDAAKRLLRKWQAGQRLLDGARLIGLPVYHWGVAISAETRQRLPKSWAPFVTAIGAAPADPLPRLIFADWLDENGHAEWSRIVRGLAGARPGVA